MAADTATPVEKPCQTIRPDTGAACAIASAAKSASAASKWMDVANVPSTPRKDGGALIVVGDGDEQQKRPEVRVAECGFVSPTVGVGSPECRLRGKSDGR